MATITWYGDGTATVAAGSRTVTGTNTGWLTEVAGLTPIKAGDKFGIHVGRPIVIEKIISNTELLLADDWPGPAQTDEPYKVELTSPTIAAVEAMRRLLASLSNGNLESLSEISVGTDDIPIGIGPGVFGVVNKYTLKDGVQFNVAVPNIAGRVAYNGSAAGFRVLVADIGDGRTALYIKNSATSGDWSVPYYITGPVGPAGINQRGNYSAGTAYAIRDIVQYGGSTWIAKVATSGNAPPTLPTTENTQWLLFARSGTAGVVDRGAYSGATAYAANDIVLDNGSTWIALQPTTGNAPPVLPAESNAYWRLLARKGTDGTGTGDVTGAASSVDGQFAAANGTTGKSIKFLTTAQARQALGGWEAIGDPYDLAGVAQADWLNLSSFSVLRLIVEGTPSAPAADVGIRVSTNNGVSFISTADYEGFVASDENTARSISVQFISSIAPLILNSAPINIYPFLSVIDIAAFNKASVFNAQSSTSYFNSVTGLSRRSTANLWGGGSSARSALRFISSTALTRGRAQLFGIRG